MGNRALSVLMFIIIVNSYKINTEDCSKSFDICLVSLSKDTVGVYCAPFKLFIVAFEKMLTILFCKCTWASNLNKIYLQRHLHINELKIIRSIKNIIIKAFVPITYK